MAKKNKFNKKDFRKRLLVMMMIYMDGLPEKKKKKLQGYVDKKLEVMVNYYVGLLRRKQRKKLTMVMAGEHMPAQVMPIAGESTEMTPV